MKNTSIIILIISFAITFFTSCKEKKIESSENTPVTDTIKVEAKTEPIDKPASAEIVKAIDKNNLALVEKLLDAGESANGTTEGYFRGGREDGANDISNKDWPLIMYAAYHNKTKMVKLLLRKNADINKVNAAGHAALFIACANRDEEMAKLLLENKAAVNAGYDRSGTSALQWALAYEWNEVALQMIRSGAELNTSSAETGKSVLLEALDGDSIKAAVIHLLIDSGANINRTNSKYKTSPLMLACSRNDIIAVNKMLAKQAIINQEDDGGSTPLCYAARNDTDNTELLELLIKNGAKVNITNSYGRNALIEAVSSGSIKKVNFLIKKGAQVNRKSEDFGGVSAIGVAAFDENLEMVKLLIDNGADISSEADNGRTVLLEAILSEKSYDIVKLLIEKGVDVNRSNDDKQTPLMKAAQYNLPAVVKILLDSGASKKGTDFYGKTALKYAEETAERTGDPAVLNLLTN